MMRSCLPFVAVIQFQPCNSEELGSRSPPLVSSYILVACILLIIFLFAVAYVFYPAYACSDEGLSCNVTTLAGTDDSNGDRTLSFVIPAYNEEKRLPIMLDETQSFLTENRKLITVLFNDIFSIESKEGDPIHYEFILVDDGSSDDTVSVIKKYAVTITDGDIIKLVSMHKNSGKGGAVTAGMLRSTGQLCLMLDADGATDISDGLIKVLKEMKSLVSNHHQRNNSDRFEIPAAVFGSRAHLEEESCASRSKVRTVLMHAFHFFVKTLCSSRIKDTQCGFKLFTRSAMAKLFTNLHLRRWAFDTELVVISEKLNIHLKEVAVSWHEVDGSKLNIGKIALAFASLGMLRDMICVRLCYFLRIWKLNR